MIKKLIPTLFMFMIIVHFTNGDSIQFSKANEIAFESDLFYSLLVIKEHRWFGDRIILKMNSEDISYIERIN
jgi:hypothetical protein